MIVVEAEKAYLNLVCPECDGQISINSGYIKAVDSYHIECASRLAKRILRRIDDAYEEGFK